MPPLAHHADRVAAVKKDLLPLYRRPSESALAISTTTASSGISIIDLVGDAPLVGLRRVGISSGANLVGALKIARPGSVMVVVFCDGGAQYWSERFWENPPEGASVGGTN